MGRYPAVPITGAFRLGPIHHIIHNALGHQDEQGLPECQVNVNTLAGAVAIGQPSHGGKRAKDTRVRIAV